MKNRLLIALLLFPVLAMAQSLKEQGASLETLVPQGWEHNEATGDLNKDGLQDLVIIATPNHKDNILVRDDGYEINMNTPQLAIYFGKQGGSFKLFKKYPELIPARDEFCIVETTLEVTDRGALRLGVSMFMTAGSADTGGPTYTFRFQNGDFYLIGKDEMEFSRYSGKATETSENYLTWKRQQKNFNMFKDNDDEVTEKWTRLKRRPLQRLGDFEF